MTNSPQSLRVKLLSDTKIESEDRREILMTRVTPVTLFKVHPLALNTETNHRALTCSCILFACCLFRAGCGHRLFIVPLPSATSVQVTRCPSCLYSAHISGKTVLKRSAKKKEKKIHSSSIPELPNWYHRYRCCPSLCPKHRNRLHPKMDNMDG